VLLKQGKGIVSAGAKTMTTVTVPTFTTSITDKSYPKDFKLVGILKYDGKHDPRAVDSLLLHCY
jgi:hypothetical protein